MADANAYDADALQVEARRQRAQVEATAAPLDDVTFAQRPEAHRWSFGECLEHLALINTIYLDAIDATIGRARGDDALRAGKRSRRHGWLGDAFVRSMEPPPRMKSGAVKGTKPLQRPRSEVLTEFLAAQDRLIRTIGEARELDLARVRMRSPFFKLLRLSLGQAFGVLLAHNRRHIWQADGALALIRSNPLTRS